MHPWTCAFRTQHNHIFHTIMNSMLWKGSYNHTIKHHLRPRKLLIKTSRISRKKLHVSSNVQGLSPLFLKLSRQLSPQQKEIHSAQENAVILNFFYSSSISWPRWKCSVTWCQCFMWMTSVLVVCQLMRTWNWCSSVNCQCNWLVTRALFLTPVNWNMKLYNSQREKEGNQMKIWW